MHSVEGGEVRLALTDENAATEASVMVTVYANNVWVSTYFSEKWVYGYGGDE